MRMKEFPNELTSLNRWVGVRNNSKVPIRCIPHDGLNDECASSTNPDTWMSYKDACVGYGLSFIDYFGFVFYEPDGLVGIDIDCGKDEDGFISDLALEIIEKCKSYTEQSRSGRGYHIILKGTLPFLGKNNKKGLEIYKSSRYFIMTGYQLMYDKIVENQEAIDYILNKYFVEEMKAIKEPSTETVGDCFYNPSYDLPKKGKIQLTPKYPTIEQGCRNQSLLSLAGQLYAKNLSKQAIYKELLKCNSEACKPPLRTDEVESIVNSIFRYER